MITGLPQNWGKQRLQSWRSQTSLVHAKTQRKGAVIPPETEPNYLLVLKGLLWRRGLRGGLTTG